MKILCITKKIYPNIDASSSCAKNILEGKDVDYITLEYIDSNDEKLPPNVHVLPTTIGKFHRFILKIFKNTKVAVFLSKMFMKLGCYHKYDGDAMSGCFSKKEFIKLASNLIEQNKYDYVLSVSAPWVCQIMGSWIKEKYPSLKWIVYEVDPYVYNLNKNPGYLEKRRNNAINIYKNVNFFFYMPGIKQYNEKMGYFAPYHKQSIELPLPKLKEPKHVKKEKIFCNDKINIVYTGIFYEGIRNPEKTLEIFSKIDLDFVLHIFGSGCTSVLNKYKQIMGDRLVLHGYSSTHDCIQAVLNADVLVAIGNSVENQIPSKIFDYFESGKPIINVMQIDNDTSKPYMDTYGNAINVKDDNYDIKNIEEFIKNRKVISFDEIAKNMHQYLLGNVQEIFFTEINKVE